MTVRASVLLACFALVFLQPAAAGPVEKILRDAVKLPDLGIYVCCPDNPSNGLPNVDDVNATIECIVAATTAHGEWMQNNMGPDEAEQDLIAISQGNPPTHLYAAAGKTQDYLVSLLACHSTTALCPQKVADLNEWAKAPEIDRDARYNNLWVTAPGVWYETSYPVTQQDLFQRIHFEYDWRGESGC